MENTRYRIVMLLLVLIFSGVGWSQENLIFNEIQERKANGLHFKTINGVFTKSQKNQNELKHFKNANEVSFLNYNNILMHAESGEEITISIPLNGIETQLDLVKVSDAFYNFTITTSNGQNISPNRNNLHYRGTIRGEVHSIVALSFFEDEVVGIVTTSAGNFNLSRVKNTEQLILYNERNLKVNKGFNCETVDDALNPYDPEILFKESKSSIITGECVRVYLETDHDMYLNLSSSTVNVENFTTGLFNQLATLYENENIETTLSEIFIWVTPDNYGSGVSSGLVNFVAARPTFDGDVAQLLSYRTGNTDPNNLSNAGGRANGIGGLCIVGNSSLSPHSHTSLFPDYENFPVFSRQVKVVTHEMGHNLGSRHTHACVWNGNGTAIDGCADATEGNCPVPGYPSGGGTIMSYCDRQSVGINFNLGFGQQPGNLIRDRVANATCLGTCVNCPSDLTITETVNPGTPDIQEAQNTVTALNIINSNANAEYDAGISVKMTAGFHARANSTFRAYIDGCTLPNPLSNGLNNTEYVFNASDENALEVLPREVKIYPNPTSGYFNLVSEDEMLRWDITNQLGNVRFGNTFNNKHETEINIDRYPSGVYFLKVIFADGEVQMKTIIKE